MTIDKFLGTVKASILLGAEKDTNLPIFAISKDSLTLQGLRDLEYLTRNEYVESHKGMYIFTQRAMDLYSKLTSKNP